MRKGSRSTNSFFVMTILSNRGLWASPDRFWLLRLLIHFKFCTQNILDAVVLVQSGCTRITASRTSMNLLLNILSSLKSSFLYRPHTPVYHWQFFMSAVHGIDCQSLLQRPSATLLCVLLAIDLLNFCCLGCSKLAFS